MLAKFKTITELTRMSSSIDFRFQDGELKYLSVELNSLRCEMKSCLSFNSKHFKGGKKLNIQNFIFLQRPIMTLTID